MVLEFILTLITIYLTLFVAYDLKLGVVRASSLVTILLGLTLLGINEFNPFEYEPILKVVFGASFIGMCSSELFNKLQFILVAIIFVLFFNYVLPHMHIDGGALGFCAFVSICAVKGALKIRKVL